jgi:hypothetical protein
MAATASPIAKTPISALTEEQKAEMSQTPVSPSTEIDNKLASATSTTSSTAHTDSANNPFSDQTYPTDKELAIPQTDDTAKVLSNPLPRSHSDTAKEVVSREIETDTAKEIVPQFGAMSMEKEVAVPSGGDDGNKVVVSQNSGLGRQPTVSRSNASLILRVEKYNPLGLVLPMDQKLSLGKIDPVTGQEMGPMFVTGDMSWIDVVSVLPPMFELFSATGGRGGGVEMKFVGRAVPRGWQGVSGLRVDVEVHKEAAQQGHEKEPEPEKWEIHRRGLGRNYKFYRKDAGWSTGFVWKGTTGTIKEMLKEQEEAGGGTKKDKLRRGNFKLVERRDGASGQVLAVWQQARGNYLGDLTIFKEAMADGLGLPVEVIVMTVLTAVNAERASGLNWISGVGK